MRKKYVKTIGLILALVLASLLAACSDDTSASDDNTELGGKDIDIPFTGAGSTARSYVLAQVLEDVGYNVTTSRVGAAGPMFASTAEDKDTINASGWFPSTDKTYLDKYGDDLTVYDKDNFIDHASLSLAVPEYMEDVDSINDLKDNKDLGKSVNWNIIGIDPRTGIMKNTEDGLDDNNLDKWDLKEGTEQSMISKLQKKYKEQEPIIITGWQPHWIFNEFDLKLLNDPDKIYGGNDDHIDLVLNKDFQSEHPAAYKIATRMADDWNKDYENDLMKQIFVDEDNPEKAAEDFVDDHSYKTDQWKQGVDKQ